MKILEEIDEKAYKKYLGITISGESQYLYAIKVYATEDDYPLWTGTTREEYNNFLDEENKKIEQIIANAKKNV